MSNLKKDFENLSGVDVDETTQKAKDYAVSTAKKVGGEAKKYAEKGAKQVAHSVSKNPLKAVGIAAAAGAILGFLFRRKK